MSINIVLKFGIEIFISSEDKSKKSKGVTNSLSISVTNLKVAGISRSLRQQAAVAYEFHKKLKFLWLACN